jgi:hypothetical protein
MLRFAKKSVLWAIPLLLAALASVCTGPATVVRAESYAEAYARVSKNLASKDPDERASAVETLCRTNDAVAVPIVVDIVMREQDPDAARRMGAAFAYFQSDKCLEALEKRVPKLTGMTNAFTALWILTGIGGNGTKRADDIIVNVLKDAKEKEYYLRAAALEAIADANKTGLNEIVETLIRTHRDDFENAGAIVPVTATTTATRIATPENKFTLVAALADMLEFYKSDRIKFFAAQACASISGSKPYYDPYYWRYWVKLKGDMNGPNAAKPRRTDDRKIPKFFDTEAVGRRILFVIDNSGSMQGPVTVPKPEPKKDQPPPPDDKKGPTTGKDREKEKGKDGKGKDEKKEVPPPDYSKVKTKLDLAKVELIYTLEQLDPTFSVNIIVYNTTHDYISPQIKGFVPADEANIKLLKEKVQLLAATGATNIHGALMRSFRTTTSGAIKGDPALDPDALMNGADTLFFLTDGTPTISDAGLKGVNSGVPNAQASDKYVQGPVILADARRVNTFRKVVINTVGIGPHAADLLRGLAKSSGGTYKDMSGA